MAWLKVYEWERERWPEFRSKVVSFDEAKLYVRKLCRHFKLPKPLVVGDKRQGRADYYSGFWRTNSEGAWYDGRIRFTTNSINLGTVCHEFAHHMNRKRWNGKGHGRTFKRELKRTYTFAKRYLEVGEAQQSLGE